MATFGFLTLLIIHISLLVSFCFAGDPFVNYEFEVTYITASPLGVPQPVCPSDLSPPFYIPALSLSLSVYFLKWVYFIFVDVKWVGFCSLKFGLFGFRSTQCA